MGKKTTLAVDNAEAISPATELDAEKQSAAHAENQSMPNAYLANRDVERRLLRKLDLRVVPLVMLLCK
jgi:hypothetical protein